MRKRLIDVTSDFLTGGIFSYIAGVNGYTVPWDTAPDVLDAEYYGNHSGGKLISPLICRLLDLDDAEQLTAARLQQLAKIIVNRYGKQWEKLYAVFSAEYNPIENYSMTEHEESDGTNTGTVGEVASDTISRTRQGSNTGTVQNSGSETIDRDTTSSADVDTENANDIYGFDSSTASPSDSQTGSTNSTGSGTEDVETTRTNTRTDNLAHTETETGTDGRNATRTDNLSHEDERTLTRSGNIGVTTSQQMLESEIALWQYDFFAIVYANIDKVLTIPVY